MPSSEAYLYVIQVFKKQGTVRNATPLYICYYKLFRTLSSKVEQLGVLGYSLRTVHSFGREVLFLQMFQGQYHF